MQRILITGGAGFVGSSLALHLRLLFPAADIVCLDNLYRRGSELNRDRLQAAGISFIRADVREKASFDIPAVDLIIDAAAEPSVAAGADGDAEYVVDTNLGGTLNVLEAARRWSAAVLFLSTSRVYPVQALRDISLDEGDQRFNVSAEQSQPGVSAAGISEEFPLSGQRTLYGATKYASEIMVQEYAAQFGVRAVVNRCGVIAGPWQMGRVDQGIVSLWVAAHCYERPLKYIGYGGKQVRDVLHVDDIAALVEQQLSGVNDWKGEVFNVGGGPEVSVSLRELTELCRKATGNTITIGMDDQVRDGDVPLYLTDSSRVKARWGWSPQHDMAKVVGDTTTWIRENEVALRDVLGG